MNRHVILSHKAIPVKMTMEVNFKSDKRSLKGLSSSGNHSDDNIHKVQEQSQCHEWDRANESNKHSIHIVEDGVAMEMPHSYSSS